MSFLTRYRNWIAVIALVVVGFFIYTYFFTSTPEPVLSASTPSQNALVDADLIALLSELKSIQLDDSIFKDQTFLSLHDFSQTLVPEPVGRQNPFAPLGTGK